MANYGKPRILGRVIVLLLLILVLVGGGIVWFDYLNVIDAKTLLSPLYKFIGREGRTQTASSDKELISLDAERLAVRLEALELQKVDLEKQKQDLQNQRNELDQIAAELEERQKALDEQEQSYNALVQESETRERNIEQNARYLNGMPPVQAVAIIVNMEDQDIIEVFRKLEEIAAAEGTTSIVSYWMSLMPAERAAELQRKMARQPSALS
ncbi:MAG: flagellar protein FlbB [Spirochaetaceae bacterium]|nr:flagellar protein FlbB [Spirochaetaceae bacterium]